MAAAGGRQPTAGPAHSSPLVVVAFLCLAGSTQMLLALYGLLSRYVQVVSVPKMPALRLVVICNLLAEAAMVVFHLAPKLLLGWARQRQRQGQRQRQLELPTTRPQLEQHSPGASKESDKSSGDDLAGSGAAAAGAAERGAGASQAAAKLPADVEQQQAADKPQQAQQAPQQQQQQQPTQQQQQPGGGGHKQGPGRPRLAHAKTTLRPDMPLARGLSRRFDRWEAQRPGLRRQLAAAAITVSFMGCCSLQILAPGFVDVSIVQLTTQWTTLAIALAQALLLRHRLPRAFWPCAAAMLGGACCVIIPSIQRSTAGGLNTVRSWMGFVMAIGALLSTVVYYILLQATRHFGFSSLQLQHYMNVLSVLFFMCLSLPIDGTDWAAGFVGWGAADWLSLLSLSTACYIGSGTLMQICVRNLGAPTAAMFFGLRLVFAVALSSPILGSTVIQTGVQIAGVAITAVAVTCYAASQWWASRQAQRRAAAAAAAQEEEQDGGSDEVA